MPYRETLEFMLFDWLGSRELFARDRFADHSAETFGAVFDTCERVASENFAPHNRTADLQEPQLRDDRVVLPDCSTEAHNAYVATGMLAAGQDYALGGMQLPYIAELAANGFFIKASVGLWGEAMLTVGNANLILAHGSERQRAVFTANAFAGRFSGTMCLSEPHAGSSLSDITTRAVPDGTDCADDPLGARYRVFGNKMWISCGDHDLSENIIHLVLAKIPGADGRLVAGTKGISLLIVPKLLVSADGTATGERNDVVVAGLNHKMGFRGAPNTALNFGEGKYPVHGRAGAIGYLVGEAGHGLQCMFHMMNEARIGVGFMATMLGQAGLETSSDYARSRRQGRIAGRKDPDAPQVAIIEHADIRRMLLAQKAYSDGALALCLYGARLVDDRNSGDAVSAREADGLLDLLTPVIKSWPSEWALEANNFAIQVLGGAGYTRDFPVEQYWRDNRLNMIHEGTNGIQALDLLGRKVRMRDGEALGLLKKRVQATIAAAAAHAGLRHHGDHLAEAFAKLETATAASIASQPPERGLANASVYLNGFGHTVVAWLWLDMMIRIESEVSSEADTVRLGLAAAARYFFAFELPLAAHWFGLVGNPLIMESDPSWL